MAAILEGIPQQAGVPDGDLTRGLQGVVASVGFLGAETIISYQRQWAVLSARLHW